jgi:hypothetical protein
MLFKPYGPFPLTEANGALDFGLKYGRLKPFWRSLGKRFPGLPQAIGCFVFATCSKRCGLVPWYVGQTCRTSFEKEVLDYDKRRLLRKLLRPRHSSEIVVFLFAYQTANGQFKKSSRKLYEVRILEELLMLAALFCNPDLSNLVYIGNVRRFVIPGFMNGGRRNNSASAKAVAELFRARANWKC